MTDIQEIRDHFPSAKTYLSCAQAVEAHGYSPAVYIFHNWSTGEVLYIGKATNLSDRLRNHTQGVQRCGYHNIQYRLTVIVDKVTEKSVGHLEQYLIATYPTEWNGKPEKPKQTDQAADAADLHEVAKLLAHRCQGDQVYQSKLPGRSVLYLNLDDDDREEVIRILMDSYGVEYHGTKYHFPDLTI